MTEEDIFPLYQLLKEDPRYPLDAYRFIRDALSYAQDELKLGEDARPEPSLELESNAPQVVPERHITGEQLCDAIRIFATEQFGLMAKTVLNSWGMKTTGDFGEIVYNLISIGWMKKSSRDRRDHFDDVFDFDKAFVEDFQITIPE